MPAREAEYRNLILNQRVEVSNPFVAPAVWKGCGGPVGSLENISVYGGLDLSEAADLTALVLIGKRDGKWRVKPTFWLPSEGLAEKSVADRVPYDMWARQGYLETTPGRSISYEFVAFYLRDIFRRYDIRKLAFDRWNFKHLLPWLLKAGMSEQFVKDHFVEFGEGMQSMSPALRDLEQVLLEGELAHGNHPVLTMCVTNTVIAVDDAGNRKPSKRRSTGRIDGMIALAMAVGVAPLPTKQIDISTLIV
jgi:phage terminase large subunit-like protein